MRFIIVHSFVLVSASGATSLLSFFKIYIYIYIYIYCIGVLVNKLQTFLYVDPSGGIIYIYIYHMLYVI